MSLKDKKAKRLYKSLFIFTSILLILVLSFLVFEIYNKDASSKNKTFTQDDYMHQVEVSRQLNSVLKIDFELLKTKDFKTSLKSYQSLQNEIDTDTIRQLLETRIRFLKDTLNTIGNGNSRKDLINVLSQTKIINDSLQIRLANSDSISNQQLIASQDKIDSLKNLISAKNAELKRKEKVQVLTFSNANGNTIHYLGEIKNGKANGGGVGIWDTGSIYKGDWKNNLRHGEGVFEWTDGQKYEGDFKNDIRTGEGKYFWPNGEKYVGEFENNQINGQGKLIDPNGNIEYKGEWKNGKPKL